MSPHATEHDTATSDSRDLVNLPCVDDWSLPRAALSTVNYAWRLLHAS